MSDIGPLPAKLTPFGVDQPPVSSKPGAGQDTGEAKFAKVLAEEQAALSRTIPDAASIKMQAPARELPAGAVPNEPAGEPSLAPISTAPNTGSNASAHSYSAQTNVSDAAIAFGARAIVAPSSFAHRSEELLLAPSEISAADVADLQRKMEMRPEPNADFGKGDRNARPALGISTSLVTSTLLMLPPLTQAAMTPSAAAAKASNPALAAARTSAAAKLDTNIPSPERMAGNTPARIVSAPVIQSSAFVQLLASPSEYRLMIRGQKLSESEREQLMQEINSSLTQLGLPFHPVQIMHLERES